MVGHVVAVARSERHEFTKPRVESIRLVAGLGVDGDAHSGRTVQHRSRVREDPTQPNLRQVHLIHAELFDELAGKGYSIAAGELGENVTTVGIALLDLPGFGHSPAPRGPLSLDHLADVAAAHAASLGWVDGVDVVGQSHGGAVAQTLAVRHPALVRSLVLLGTMAFPAHTSIRLAMLPGAAAVMVGLVRHGRSLPGLM